MLVVDASAAYNVLLSDRSDFALEQSGELTAPDLIVSELLNSRWKGARARLATPPIEAILSFLNRVRIVPSLPYAADAAELAERLNHAVYDCIYIALARREGLKLLTIDAHLSRKMRAHKLGSLLA